jgi:hypothetical protein
VVQGAQDAIMKTAELIKQVTSKNAELATKNAELEALLAGQGK